MSADEAEGAPEPLVLDYRLDAPPEKVWRAISMPGLREAWLPGADLADPEPIVLAPGEALRYRMREDEPPFRESAVTFRISADAAGGTRLNVIHERAACPGGRTIMAANSNAPPLLRAA